MRRIPSPSHNPAWVETCGDQHCGSGGVNAEAIRVRRARSQMDKPQCGAHGLSEGGAHSRRLVRPPRVPEGSCLLVWHYRSLIRCGLSQHFIAGLRQSRVARRLGAYAAGILRPGKPWPRWLPTGPAKLSDRLATTRLLLRDPTGRPAVSTADLPAQSRVALRPIAARNCPSLEGAGTAYSPAAAHRAAAPVRDTASCNRGAAPRGARPAGISTLGPTAA